jgi:hypothetical protein
MTTIRTFIPMVLTLFLAACSGHVSEIDGSLDDPPPFAAMPAADGTPQCVVLGVWVQEDPDLSEPLALVGSDLWEDVGVCGMSATREEAHIRIYANPILCPPAFDKMGMPAGWILATAYGGQGTVVVNTDCLWRPLGPRTAPNAEQFRNMIAHEIGHVLGVWEHVPRECTDAEGNLLPDIPIHASGAPICGPAIMNPGIDPALSRLTGSDILQFDRRSLDVSVLPVPPMADMRTLGTPSCTVVSTTR